jgi:6-phosphogluconolactonase
MNKPEIIIAPELEKWAKRAADLIIQSGQHALEDRGEFSLVLAGGSTPHQVYRELAKRKDQLNWDQVYLFWGDERCVPLDHPDSNFLMAKESLIAHLSIPQQNIFRLLGEIDPPLAAQDYEEMISAYFYKKEKRFDTILLGLGDDGHTASLFPGTPALEENRRWVVENPHPYSDTTRLTMTFPALNSGRQIVFLVTGQNKAEVVSDILKRPSLHPAANVTGSDETTISWLLDKQAANQL